MVINSTLVADIEFFDELALFDRPMTVIKFTWLFRNVFTSQWIESLATILFGENVEGLLYHAGVSNHVSLSYTFIFVSLTSVYQSYDAMIDHSSPCHKLEGFRPTGHKIIERENNDIDAWSHTHSEGTDKNRLNNHRINLSDKFYHKTSLVLLASQKWAILVIGTPHCVDSNKINPNFLGCYLIHTWSACWLFFYYI